MKRGTDLNIKFKRTMRSLNLSIWETKGVLQAIWDLTAESAMQGNIGRLTNEDIALGIGWSKDPDELVHCLVNDGWLDHSNEHRLLVHDWHEHCEDWIKKRLERAGKAFLSDNGGQRQTTADNGCHRLPSSASGSLPGPGPGPEPIPCSSPSAQTDKPKAAKIPASQIDAIWDAYPRKVGKKVALPLIAKAIKQAGYDVVLAAVKRYAASRAGQAPQFTANPRTWFNQGRWEDEPDKVIETPRSRPVDRDAERRNAEIADAEAKSRELDAWWAKLDEDEQRRIADEAWERMPSSAKRVVDRDAPPFGQSPWRAFISEAWESTNDGSNDTARDSGGSVASD